MSPATASPADRDLLILNARLLDGRSPTPAESTAILVRDGRIAEIGPALSADGVRVLDVAGATVMPGLIDAHVHLQSVPGSVYRRDSDEQLQAYRLHHLKAYLACGVTAVLDNAIAAPVLRSFQEHLAGGGAGPSIYALAPTLYPPGGYLDGGMLTPYWGPQWKPAANEDDIRSLFADYEGLENIVGVKVVLEPGFGATAIWPIHSPAMREAIVRQAREHGLPIHIHAYKKKEQALSLDMGVHNLVHSGFLKGSPSREFLERVKAGGTYVTTTLASTMDQMLVQFDLNRLNDPLIELAVPKAQIETARDLAAWKDMFGTFMRSTSPRWMPSFVLNFILRMINVEKEVRACLANASQALAAMHRAGIPLVVGTDTSSWPIFLNYFHGPSTIREIELLGEAGLPAGDVLASATRIAAEMMSVADQIGTVEKGKRADLIVAPEDPLLNLSALRNLRWVIKDGRARTPAEWMAAA